MRKINSTVLAVVLGLSVAQLAAAEGWGGIRGQFVYDGKAPKAGAINVDKDVAFCGPFDLKNETLVVNPKNGGVKNVVVYLYVSRDGKKPPPSPKAAELPKEVRIDNEKCRFEPRIAVMTKDQTLVIGNKDQVAHNSKIDVINQDNVSVNPIIPAGKDYPHTFNAAESLPIPIGCSIHPWMNGYILIKDDPYFGVTDEDGKFEIDGLPEGEWTFRFWQENIGYVQKVKQGGKSSTWRRGELKITIKDGKVFDLGEVKSTFTKK